MSKTKIVFTSSKLAEILWNYFWIDDVWVTGSLAYELSITHLDLAKHWTMHFDFHLAMYICVCV